MQHAGTGSYGSIPWMLVLLATQNIPAALQEHILI